ncbi:hypothetical protein BsWGS_20111 [Bradybaena similaris]
MGIIVGIVTYLKREQAEMEEDKMFDTYMQLRREPLDIQKKERVQKMALYLKQLEEQKAGRENNDKAKASESQQPHSQLQHRHQSCYSCTSQESPCQECKTVPPPLSNTRHCATDATTFNISASQGAENKEGPLCLSSAPLCECEPMLTPDPKKRVAFPDHSVFEGKNISEPTSWRAGTYSFQTPAYKSAFKRSPNSVHRSQTSTSEPREIDPDKSLQTETKTPFLNVISPVHVSLYTLNVLEKRDEESMELNQLAASAKAVYHECCLPGGNISNDYGRLSGNQAIVSPSSKHGQHLASSSFINSQPSSQIVKQTPHLSIHAKCGENQYVSPGLHNEVTPNAAKSGRSLYLSSSNLPTSPEREDAIVWPMPCDKPSEALQHQKQFNQMQQLKECESQKQQYQRPREPMTLTVEKDSASLVSTPTWHDTSPLLRSQSPQSPLVLSYQITPQTSPGAHILRLLTEDGSDNTPASSTDSALPDDVTGPQCQSMRPCIKSRSQNFHMTGVTRTRQFGLDWRNKTNDKQLLPRSQPERRGALFFTQRSLQRDVDNPKTSGHVKPSRPPNIFHRQDNSDSGNSRHSESEAQDSVRDNTTNFFCTSTSGDSNPVPASTTGRDHKRNQRLTSSQTLDSFTYL